jgi:gluconate 5-dehydrogenase
MKAKTPMHRTCAAWELCGALIYLLSDASSFTTGAEIMIDGGITLW